MGSLSRTKDDQIKIERLNELFGQMVRMQGESSRTAWNSLRDEAERVLASLELVPLAPLEGQLEAIAGKTSQSLGKLVRWNSQGFGLHVPGAIRDALFDSLVHGIRNAVDHGIESPEIRRGRKKLAAGNLGVTLFQRGSTLDAVLEDDGQGLVLERIQARAIEVGLVPKSGKTLTFADAAELLFMPGFSTQSEATEVSGRGVGLDAVRMRLREMGGEAIMEARNPGAALKLKFPLAQLGVPATGFQLHGLRFWVADGGFEFVDRDRPPKSAALEQGRRFLGRLGIQGGDDLSWIRLRSPLLLSAQGEVLVPIQSVIGEGFRVFRVAEPTWSEPGADEKISAWLRAVSRGILACYTTAQGSPCPIEPLLDFGSFLEIAEA